MYQTKLGVKSAGYFLFKPRIHVNHIYEIFNILKNIPKDWNNIYICSPTVFILSHRFRFTVLVKLICKSKPIDHKIINKTTQNFILFSCKIICLWPESRPLFRRSRFPSIQISFLRTFFWGKQTGKIAGSQIWRVRWATQSIICIVLPSFLSTCDTMYCVCEAPVGSRHCHLTLLTDCRFNSGLYW